MNITTKIEEAQGLLEAPVFAFDIETDTQQYHWTSGERGLSYCADITHISFNAGPDLPTLVLVAQREEVEYEVDLIEYNEYGEPYWTKRSRYMKLRRALKKEWLAAGSPTEPVQIDEYTRWLPDEEKKYGIMEEWLPYKKWVYYFTADEESFLYYMFIRDTPVTAVAHNLVFDARQIFGKYHFPVDHPNLTFWDTQPIEILGLFGSSDHNSLMDLYSRYGKFEKGEGEWLEHMKTNRNKLDTLPAEDVLRYSAWDAMAAYTIYQGQQRKLEEAVTVPENINELPKDKKLEAQKRIYRKLPELLPIELEYTRWCVHAAVRGIRLDVNYARRRLVETIIPEWIGTLGDLGLDRSTEGNTRKKEWLEDFIFNVAGVPKPTFDEVEANLGLLTASNRAKFEEDPQKFNLNEPGIWSFSQEAMFFYLGGDWQDSKYDPEDCPFPELLPLVKHFLTNTVKDDVEEFLRHAEHDGYIHPILTRKQVTGRTSCSQPNVHSFAVSKHPGILVARPGYVLIEMDYSNAENWAQAGNAKDNRFALACAEEDFHTAMARGYAGEAVWATLSKEERKTLRKKGKAFTFGIPYGMGVKKLARRAHMSREDAARIVENRKRSYPDVADATDAISEYAEKWGFVTLWTGRRVAIRKSFDATRKRWEYKGYTGWNSMAQGGIGELVVRAINQIWGWLRENRHSTDMVMMVHDAIIFELKIEEYRAVVQPIIQMMAHIIPEEWNNRTKPAIRWLTDLDNLANSQKWGYVDGEEYPLPLNEYINEWGTHERNPDDEKAPVWINQWGWGMAALEREAEELGYELPKSVEQEAQEEREEERRQEPEYFQPVPSYEWSTLEVVLKRVVSVIGPIRAMDRVFDFSNGMAVLEDLYKKGHGADYEIFIQQFDQLAKVMEDYSKWRKS